MKYIKYFKTHAEYIKYITDNKKILPNLSSCEDNDDIHISQDERRIFASINNNINKTLMLYIDNFRQNICDRDYNSDMLAFKQDCVQNFDTKDGINVYIYTGETFTYNNTEYYLWERPDFKYMLNSRYILTDRLNFEGLSLEDNINNDYCPYIYKLTQDFEEYVGTIDEDFLLAVRPKNQYQQYLDLYLYFDDFPQEIADDEYDGDMEAFKQDYLFDNIQEGNEYVYTNTTFTYNNTVYYLWESTLEYCGSVHYILTDKLNFKGLSLEDDIDNDYCPFVYILNYDMEIAYDNQDHSDYILTGIRGVSKDVFNDDANLMIYIDSFEQDFADDEFNGNITAAKQYFMEHLNLCDTYLYTNNTFTYNNIEYYLWELLYNTNSGALPYLLTDTLDFTGLSLTDNINNNYNPVCYLLSSDKDVVYGANDMQPKTLVAINGFSDNSDNSDNSDMLLYNKIVNDISGFQKIEIDGEEISLSELQENKGIYAFSKDKSYVITYTLKNSFIIESEALANTNIDDVIIPDNVRFIENEAFYNCNNLTNVTIGSSVEEICNAAFKNCVNLKTVIIKASTVPEFCNYEDEFANNANDRIIYVPSKSFLDYQNAWPQYICQDNLMPNTEPLIIIFTVESGDNYIQLFNLESTDYNIEDYFEKIIIDDVERRLSYYYDNQPYYISVGEHTVKYVIKDRVTISEELFSDNGNITNIIIPEGIQYIYAYAFSSTNIHTLVIPSTVNYISNNAFINCNDLEYIEVDNHNNTYDSRNNCNAIIQTSNNTLILGCKNTVIPNTVTRLDTYAFTGSGIQSIEIPANVSTIGDRTFQDCYSLRSITSLSATAPITSQYTFSNIANNGILNLPNGTTGYYSWISKLNQYNWSVNTPYNYELICTYNITRTDINTNLCKNKSVIVSMEIDGVSLQDKVTSYKFNTTGEHIVKFNIIDTVSSQMFSDYCTNLINIEFSEGINNIQSYAFFGCTSLTSITLPNFITNLSYCAFQGCTSITNVSIGTGITIIEQDTFRYCSGLTTLIIPANVINIGKPYSTSNNRNPFIGCSGLTSIIVDSSNLVYDSRNNCNAIIQTSTNTLVTGCQNTVIPNSVTTISDYAFSGCTSLTSITIPNSVTTISVRAFSDCTSLTTITIPNSVTTISGYIFYGCTGLETIICLGSTAPTITKYTFSSVKTGGTLYVPQGSTGYDLWMSTTNNYLGKYNWTIVYQ